MSATILCSPAELEGAEVRVEGDRFHHYFRARRLRPGENVRLTDGAGRARWSEVVAVDDGVARLSLGSVADANEATVDVGILAAMPRPERASWLVEKATEIGVRSVTFFACERAPRRVGDGMLARLERVAGAALEQCHRSILPTIEAGVRFDRLGERLDRASCSLYLDPRAEASLGEIDDGGPTLLIVGPEGGFTLDEVDRLGSWGSRSVHLVSSILRIETAALAAASVLLVSADRRSRSNGPEGE